MACKVGDSIEFNSDPDDDTDDDSEHMHHGEVIKISNKTKQITIKLLTNNEISSYFLDEIVITNINKDCKMESNKSTKTNEMLDTLMKMGFNEDLSKLATQKYPTNINQAMDFIQNRQKTNNTKDNNQGNNTTHKPSAFQPPKFHHKVPSFLSLAQPLNIKQTDNNDDEKNVNDNGSYQENEHLLCVGCDSIEKCVAIQRLIHILTVYEKYKNIDCDDDKVSDFLVMMETKRSNIVNDFHHILSTYLNADIASKSKIDESFEYIYNKITQQENIQCDITNCKIYTRNNRERQSQKPMYMDGKGVYMDLLDSVHCYFLHSVDIGYRLINKKFEKDNQSNVNHNNTKNICYDPYLSELKQYLRNKRTQLKEIRGSNRVQNNKFMTSVASKTSTEEEKARNNEDTFYSFGEEHDFWSTNVIRSHQPKYKSIKAEILSNKIYSVKKSGFDTAYNKAIFLLKTSKIIKSMKSDVNSWDNDKYGVKTGIALSLSNILAIIFYTDYDTLSYHFSSTFRRINQSDDPKERNREYWHWSKSLIETVNCWGIKMRNTNIASFYHGVSMMYFNKFITSFKSPTSTTIQLSVATIFAKDDGIILDLRQGYEPLSADLRFFNCSFISNYGNEEERLFIQPPLRTNQLKIKTIKNMATDENYGDIIQAITTLDQLFTEYGRCLDIPTKVVVNINNIIEMLINNDKSDVIPRYMQKSILKWTNIERHKLMIYMTCLCKYGGRDLNIWATWYGAFDGVGNVIRFDTIVQIMRNLKIIKCYETKTVNDAYLDELISVFRAVNNVTYSKVTLIGFYNVNMQCSAAELMKYQDLFQKENWKVQFNSSKHRIMFYRQMNK